MDKPPVIEGVDESKEKKRSYWPWKYWLGGVGALVLIGSVILIQPTTWVKCPECGHIENLRDWDQSSGCRGKIWRDIFGRHIHPHRTCGEDYPVSSSGGYWKENHTWLRIPLQFHLHARGFIPLLLIYGDQFHYPEGAPVPSPDLGDPASDTGD